MRRKTSFVITLAVAFASLSSRLLGFVRETVMAALFGAGKATDVYVVASTLPVLLFQVVAALFSATIIPVFLQALTRNREDGFRFASNLMNVSALGAMVLWLMGHVLTGPLVHLLAPGYAGPEFAATVQLTRIMLPSLLFMTLAAVATGLLQAQERFMAQAFAPVLYNVFTITLMVVFGRQYGLQSLAWGITMGAVVQVIALWPALKLSGYRHRWVFDLKDPDVRAMATLMVPVLLSLVVAQVGVIADRMVLSRLSDGSLSAVNYSARVFVLPMNIFVSAIVTVVYPAMVRQSANQQTAELGREVNRSLITMLLVVVPISGVMLLEGHAVVRMLFQRGAFDAAATQATASALAYYSLGLIPAAIFEVIQRAYFAMHDTKTPMLFASLRVALNIMFNFLLYRTFAHVAVPFGYTLSAFLGITPAIIWCYRKRQWPWRSTAVSVLKLLGAGAFMCAAMLLVQPMVKGWSDGGLVQQVAGLSATSIVGIAAFLGAAWLLRVQELNTAASLIRDGLRRRVIRGEDIA